MIGVYPRRFDHILSFDRRFFGICASSSISPGGFCFFSPLAKILPTTLGLHLMEFHFMIIYFYRAPEIFFFYSSIGNSIKNYISLQYNSIISAISGGRTF